MPTYNFRRDSKIYVVRNGLIRSLDVYSDITFSQTFNETAVKVKTLHQQFDMFDAAVITTANPANFSFTIPILLEQDHNILWNLLRDWTASSTEAILKTADLYVESNSEVYKLEMFVVESGTFLISKNSVLTLTLSGSARKLSKFTGTIPGTLQARSAQRTFSAATALNVVLDGIVQPYISAVTVEFKNDVSWIDFATLQNSVDISEASGVQYPEAFVVRERVLSGTVQQYVTEQTNSNVQSWSTSAPLTIQAGPNSSAYSLEFVIPSVVYTNRLDPGEVFVQSYDFRMNTNPALITDVIKKRNI